MRIPPIRVAEQSPTPPPAPAGKPLAIVYEDDALLVIDKPRARRCMGAAG